MGRPDDVDFELISAFIDGRLSGAERDRAVRLLADSEAAFEVYSDALRARADLGAEADKVVSIADVRARRAGVPWRTVGSVAAAAVVVIAVFPMIEARRNRAVMDVASIELVRPFVSSPEARTLALDASNARGWSVTRGGGGRLENSAVDFRLGVRVVDLQVAVAQQDTLRADRMVREIVEALNDVVTAEPVQARFEALRTDAARRGSAVELTESISRAEQALDDHLESFWFDFGRWVAAGELAARVRSAEFFASAQTERFLKVAAATGGLSTGDAELLLRIGDLGGQGVTDAEFETIREHFSTLIRRYGG